MNRFHIMSGLMLIVAVLALWHQDARAQPKAFVINLDGEIDVAVPRYVNRVLEEAREARATVVVLQINTFGGRLDAATEIKDAILNSHVPVIAYVNKRAISAGALIALSATRIAMAPGGTIGAATPVYEDGVKASEKIVSYMRSEMRSTAERNKRNPDIAEAMVDESIELDDTLLKKSGRLLTLTSDEAQKVGYSDAEASTLKEALDGFGYRNIQVIETQAQWGETMIRILTSPGISALLITIGLAGLFYGVKTGHLGTVAIVGFMAISLFFGVQYTANLADALDVILFIVGLGLIALEIFVIPGFGVTGIVGIVMLIASLFLALIGRIDLLSTDNVASPLYTLAGSLTVLSVLIFLMFRYLPTSPMFRHLVLQNTVRPPVTSSMIYQNYLGVHGTALTILRPAGVAILDDQRVDVITTGEFINAGEPVEVIRVEGVKVVVRKSV